MIKNIKLYVNNNTKSLEYAKLVKEQFTKNGFSIVEDDNYDLGIAIGGDGAFVRMIKQSSFNSKPYFVGINTGHLGFLQEVKDNELSKLIEEIKEEKYQVSKIGIQETSIISNSKEHKFYSINEIVIRDKNLDLLRAKVFIEKDFLESFTGDGIMLATSTGSTAYNLSYGGSIVYPSFSTLQITPMAPINSKSYRTMPNSIIIPANVKVTIMPNNKGIIITQDGVNKYFDNVERIESSIEDKKIKCLRFSHYNFPQKINEKFLS